MSLGVKRFGSYQQFITELNSISVQTEKHYAIWQESKAFIKDGNF